MRLLIALALLIGASPVLAAPFEVALQPFTEWKAVYGRVEARDLVPARARIGGTVVELLVSERDEVEAGAKIAVVRDEKIAFQIAAYDAELRALRARLTRAEAELERGRSLIERGVATAQRLEQLATDVEVVRNEIAATEAQRAVVLQQGEEGEVLAPIAGRVLSVPVTRGAVVMAGESVAMIGGGGFYLRLAIPERHAFDLEEGADIRIVAGGSEAGGKLVKIYPQIDNGRVIADVEVAALDDTFVDARVLVEIPVGVRDALLVPESALTARAGLDFVRVVTPGGEILRAVVPGERLMRDGIPHVEILTGLHPGETILLP